MNRPPTFSWAGLSVRCHPEAGPKLLPSILEVVKADESNFNRTCREMSTIDPATREMLAPTGNLRLILKYGCRPRAQAQQSEPPASLCGGAPAGAHAVAV